MNPYIIKLNKYLSQTCTEEPSSILDFLRQCYLECNPVQGEEISKIQDALEPFFDALPDERSNLLFSLLYDLCSQYEQAAFSAGLQVGLRLMFEVDPSPAQPR